jgi:hypothetical protein
MAAAVRSAGSTKVEVETVAAARSVTCKLTRALRTRSKLSSGTTDATTDATVDAAAWSASMLLRVGEKATFGG